MSVSKKWDLEIGSLGLVITPTIFYSGFETGNFNDFDCTSGGPTVQSTIKYAGTYAMKTGSSDIWNTHIAAKLISFPSQYYIQGRIRIDEWTTITEGDWGFLLGVANGVCGADPYASTRAFALGIEVIGGKNKLILYKGQTVSSYDLGISLTLQKWYNVIIGIYNHGTNGWVKIWIDGILKYTLTSQDTNDMTSYLWVSQVVLLVLEMEMKPFISMK